MDRAINQKAWKAVAKHCILLKLRHIIYDVEFFCDTVRVNKPQTVIISTLVIFLFRNHSAVQKALSIPFIKANKLKYNLPNYTACVSVSLP